MCNAMHCFWKKDVGTKSCIGWKLETIFSLEDHLNCNSQITLDKEIQPQILMLLFDQMLILYLLILLLLYINFKKKLKTAFLSKLFMHTSLIYNSNSNIHLASRLIHSNTCLMSLNN